MRSPKRYSRSTSLDATATFYGDNTEFFNPFRKGETTLGAHLSVAKLRRD